MRRGIMGMSYSGNMDYSDEAEAQLMTNMELCNAILSNPESSDSDHEELVSLAKAYVVAQEKLETIKQVANVLYRHPCWNEMPWGAKQILSGMVEKDGVVE